MQLRRLRQLLSLRRFQRCRRLFQSPVRAFLSSSFAGRRPVELALKSGGRLKFSRDDRDHHLWDWALTDPTEPPLAFTSDGLVEVKYAGRTLLLRPGTLDAFVFREIFFQDVYGLRTMPARLGVVVDLGANAGLFTCAVLPRAQRVIAVEAVQRNYEHACRNIALNNNSLNGGRTDDVLRCAVARASGTPLRIYHNRKNSGGHSLFRDALDSHGEASFETVDSISLADLLQQMGCPEVDLLKCDVEGAEYEVFLNTPRDVLRRIARLAMEVHLSPELPPERLKSLIAYLDSAGFQVATERPIPHAVDRWQGMVLRATGPRALAPPAQAPQDRTAA